MPQTLTVVQTIVSQHTWLYASTVLTSKGIGLFVYRSLMLVTTDDIYAPVKAKLKAHHSKLVYQEIVDDPDMMLGRAEISCYKLEGLND